jgi:poly(3-hydroxyalkanoate) synthetase
MGMVDSKAVIKYIKQETGQEKITYIGMSQGAASMFFALSLDSEWFKDNLNLFCAV